MKIRTCLVFLFAVLLACAAGANDQQKRGTAEPKVCEHDIRKMLSGRRYLGLQIIDLHPGVIIKAVNPDGPASHVDLKEGDRIIAVNGSLLPLLGASEFKQVLAEAKETGVLFMIVQRRGAYRKVDVRLEPYPRTQIDKI